MNVIAAWANKLRYRSLLTPPPAMTMHVSRDTRGPSSPLHMLYTFLLLLNARSFHQHTTLSSFNSFEQTIHIPHVQPEQTPYSKVSAPACAIVTELTEIPQMEGEQFFLTYEHRANGRNMVPDGLSLMTEFDLVVVMSQRKCSSPFNLGPITDKFTDDDIRKVEKKITPGCTSIEIYKADLMTEEEKVAAAKAKKADGEQAECPWMVFLGHNFEGHSFEELTILVPEIVAKGGE